MTLIAVQCPHCHSEHIIKRGKTARGTQRYLCQNALCTTGNFLLDYRNRGCLSEVKQQIIDMSLNTSGVRDTVAVAAHQSHHCAECTPGTFIKQTQLHILRAFLVPDIATKVAPQLTVVTSTIARSGVAVPRAGRPRRFWGAQRGRSTE